MIEIKRHPSKYCFAGDPMIFEVESTTTDVINIGLTVNGETYKFTRYPFGNEAPYKTDIDISSLLASLFKKDPGITAYQIMVVELEDFMLDVNVNIETESFDLHVINGGTNKGILKELSLIGHDLFSFRLLDPTKQFLFTTRTHSQHITLKESELFPFAFIHPGKAITFKAISGKTISVPALASGTTCLMDFNTVRETFWKLYNEIPSYIEVSVDNAYAFDLTITPSKISESSQLLRFKNSLGIFENIEITGAAYFIPELSKTENHLTLNENSVYEAARDRVSMTEIYKISTGYKSTDELHHILDLLSSDLCYIIFQDQRVRKCIVTAADDVKIKLPIVTPTALQLNVQLVAEDPFYTPSLGINYKKPWFLETRIWNDINSWKDNKDWNE